METTTIIPKFTAGWTDFILAFKGWYRWCDNKSEENTWNNLQKIVCHRNYTLFPGLAQEQVYNIIMNGVDEYNKWCIGNGHQYKILLMRDLNDSMTDITFREFSFKLKMIINVGYFFAHQDAELFHFDKPHFHKGNILEFRNKRPGMTYREMNRMVERYKW